MERPRTKSPIVRLASAHDNAQGQHLKVYWNDEIACRGPQDEIRQARWNAWSWGRRIKEVDKDLETAPDCVRSLFEVQARRVEPVGLAYLWTESN